METTHQKTPKDTKKKPKRKPRHSSLGPWSIAQGRGKEKRVIIPNAEMGFTQMQQEVAKSKRPERPSE